MNEKKKTEREKHRVNRKVREMKESERETVRVSETVRKKEIRLRKILFLILCNLYNCT